NEPPPAPVTFNTKALCVGTRVLAFGNLLQTSPAESAKGVNAGEPHLADSLILGEAPAVARVDRIFAGLIPQHGMERRAFVIERQGMSSAQDLRMERSARQLQRPDSAASVRHGAPDFGCGLARSI